MTVAVESVTKGNVVVSLLSKTPVWTFSGAENFDPFEMLMQRWSLADGLGLGSQWFWKLILTPPSAEVPLMRKSAVNKSPVVPNGRKLGKITAARIVVGLSIVAFPVHAPELPKSVVEPTHPARGMELAGIMLPVKSTPNGVSTCFPPESVVELTVMSNPLKVSVLLIIIGTLIAVLGVVRGPLKVGGLVGHLPAETSVTAAIHIRPVVAACARGIICPEKIPMTIRGTSRTRTLNPFFKLDSSLRIRFFAH